MIINNRKTYPGLTITFFKERKTAMDEYFDRQNENEEGRTEAGFSETEETAAEKDSSTNGFETAETVEEGSVGMTDEEIKRAAENIGSPYTEYEYGQSTYTNNTVNTDNTNNTSGYSYGSNYSDNTNTDKETKKQKTGKGLKAAKFLAIAAAFGMIAGACFFGTERALDLAFDDEETTVTSSSYGDNSQTASNVGVTSLIVSNNNNVTSSDGDSTVVSVVKENMSATVAISAKYVTTTRYFGQTYQYESQGGGSGFIVGKNDTELLVATNCHVVEDTSELAVVFCDDTSVACTVRATDADNDLAIVSVKLSDIPSDTMSKIKIATLGNSDNSDVGEMVIAIGNALGYGQSVTVGYLSAKEREITTETTTMTVLQTDAAINDGNSGGPLFNTSGEVIGINCAKYKSTGVEGVCYAIPISKAIPILENLMTIEKVAEDEQGYLGVSIKTITEDIASFYGWPTGVYVFSVVENGSAAKAGLVKGDIITAINGKSTLDAESLKEAVNAYRYGTTVSVTIKRMNDSGEFEEKTIDVTLMKKPNT